MISRTGFLIILVLYLSSVFIMLGYIGNTFNTDSEYYDSLEKTIRVGFVVNIVVGVSILPIWLNTILFTIPVGLLAYLIIAGFFPTGNAGA